MRRIRLATRASTLALAQATWVGERLRTLDPELGYELVEVTTSGDRDQTSPVAALTETGAFVRAVQQAVLDGTADLAVHSAKDLPVHGPDGLADHHPERESPWDALCGTALGDLDDGATVATGSPRRSAQLAVLRPDLRIVDIRGNVDTRLRRVAGGYAAAAVLAEAGLNRIGLAARVDHRFDLAQMIPAPAQGALSLEARTGSDAAGLAAQIAHEATGLAVAAEREVLRITGAGCRSSLAVHAEIDTRITLHGFVDDDRGPRRATAEGDSPHEAAERLARELGLAA